MTARTSTMKPDRVSAAVDAIGAPWRTCLDERCRNTARRHMALFASVNPDEPPEAIAVQGLRAINVIARVVTDANETDHVVVPSDQWSKAHA